MNRSTLTQQFREIKIPGYEKVVEVKDASSGLHAIISIHSTLLGPAIGGTRMYNYRGFEDGLNDVLRLSKGMSIKYAITGQGFGGGKAVIFGDPKKHKTPALLEAFGRAVDTFKGKYITAEDSGITPDDLFDIRKGTRYIIGLRHENCSGDGSSFTAWGTFLSIQATCKQIFGSPSVKNKVIAIQGLGAVGEPLAEMLYWHGAVLKVADLDESKAKKVAQKTGATIEDPADILRTKCDILAPCAMGAVFNDETILTLNCKGIAGAANNMLADDYHGQMIQNLGIWYAPDFIANAGGGISAAAGLEKDNFDPIKTRELIDEIYGRIEQVYQMAKSKNMSTVKAALTIAEYKMKNKIGVRSRPPVYHH